VLLHPEQISAKFDSWFLAHWRHSPSRRDARHQRGGQLRLAGLRLLEHVFPRQISFKRGGYIAAASRWCSIRSRPGKGAAHFVNFIGSTMGPLFGVMMVDYYLIRKGELNVAALYQENGEFRFQGGWHDRIAPAIACG
jgi:NCS1 family nucleobase:cation symporter-1